MRYMLVNNSVGNLQVDLYKSKVTYKNKNLNRIAPHVALSLKKGTSVDILPHFDGSLEDAHDAVMHSIDSLRRLNPRHLNVYVCDDEGKELDIEKLLAKDVEEVPSKKKKKSRSEDVTDKVSIDPEDITRPDFGQGAVMAAVDHHESKMKEDKKSKKKKKSKK